MVDSVRSLGEGLNEETASCERPEVSTEEEYKLWIDVQNGRKRFPIL